MNFLLLSLLPAMAVAITDFATCDATPTLACLAADDCVTAGLPAGTPCNSDATTPIGAAPAAPGCCIAAATTTTAATTVAGSVTTVAGTTCVDKLNPLTGVSDCPARASLCNNSVYLDVMRDQCPKTCNFCSSTGTGTSTNSTITSCVDRVNPNTGISDCPTMKAYCNNSIYLPLMRIQCPASCGFCTSG
ncbi:hypothetical protein PENTCL1PPCAC_17320 [Pristionchus entomophagus]|uniref:ShKT domain-containing protein n=1 Tax=Pristionchus entomophagus TaxID=358040 RepID=A0AAV5TLJ2_9BILA|nr:hypothetical protein PENTCL1PPCAC_17320 [Pristionchus entomophagus]